MEITYTEFKNRILEHSIYVGDLSRFDNYLKHVNDEKLILMDLKNEMSKFKDMISHFNNSSIFKLNYQEDDKYILINVKYNDKIEIIIQKLKDILENITDDDILNKSYRIVYGIDMEMNFHIDIDIEKNNFNRIHIINDLPYSIRNLNMGKILYKNIIKEIGWITSNYDSSKDSKFVWDSLNKDDELYTCIKDMSIICFDYNLNINIIENILRKWIKESEKYILDNDMLKKYINFDEKLKNNQYENKESSEIVGH